MRSPVVGLILLASACTRPPEAEPLEAPADAAVDEPQREPLLPDEPAAPDDPANDPNVFVGTIVGESPIGDGQCVQHSYEVKPADPARARVWIHFERCGDAGPSPAEGGLDGLDVGSTYEFTVRPGASRNYGNDPILMGAQPR